MIRVEDHEHLFREESGAIINTDTNQYNQYMKMKFEKKKQREEIEQIKSDITEIKSLLMRLINKDR